jgi:G protein beta subunit-like protein
MLRILTRLLATASADHTVKLWNVKDFSLAKTLSGHQRWVWDCAFSADSAYLVTGLLVSLHSPSLLASSDQVARLWDLSQGETIRTYNSHNKAITCVALNDVTERK